MNKFSNKKRRREKSIALMLLITIFIGFVLTPSNASSATENVANAKSEQSLKNNSLNVVIKKVLPNDSKDNMYSLSIKEVNKDVNKMEIKLENFNGESIGIKNTDGKEIKANKDGFIELDKNSSRDLLFSTKDDSVKLTVKYKIDNKDEEIFLTKKAGDMIDIKILNQEEKIEEEVKENEKVEENDDSKIEESNTNDLVSDEIIEEDEVFGEAVTYANTDSDSKAGDAVTGVKHIPYGGVTLGDVFAEPNGTGINIEGKQSDEENEGILYSEISMLGQNNKTSLWSNDEHKLDFNKSFKGSMYVNFGKQDADGFAFVMHNDSNKTKALTTANAKSDGQNLGVYRSTNAYRDPITGLHEVYPYDLAIRNSVAVEFDLIRNASTGGTNQAGYDYGISTGEGTPHMAYTFPGSKSKTYIPIDNKGNEKKNWFETLNITGEGRTAKMNHNNSNLALNMALGVVENGVNNFTNIQNGNWYEFVYEFNSSTKVFTYYLRDPLYNKLTRVTQIPWSDIESELALSKNNNQAYWGFTAANGKAEGETKIVFHDIPVGLTVDVKTDVLDKSGNSVVVPRDDTTKNPYVKAGEPITVSSEVSVANNGRLTNISNWITILEEEAILLTGDNPITEVVAIKNKGLVNEERIEGTLVKSDKEEEKEYIVAEFKNLNIKPNETVTLTYKVNTLEGDVESIKTNVQGAVVTKEIDARSNAIFQGDSKYFWVKDVDSPTELSWENNNIVKDLPIDKDISEITEGGLDQNLYWRDIDAGDKLQFQVKNLSGDVINTYNVVTTGDNVFHELHFNIPKDKFDYGENKFNIEVYKLNALGEPYKRLDYLNLNVNVSGRLSLEIAPDIFKWTNRNIRDSKGELSRDDDNPMQLTVLDSRKEESSWKIGATIKRADDKEPKFNFVWKNTDEQSKDMEGTTTFIMKNDGFGKEEYKYNQEWNQNEGVLLNSKGYLPAGDYSGQAEVVWTLYDTEDPE